MPPGIALALFGTAERGTSAVAFFPWLSPALVAEHRNRNDICGKTLQAVAEDRLRSCEDDRKGPPVFDDARQAVPPFFQSFQTLLPFLQSRLTATS